MRASEVTFEFELEEELQAKLQNSWITKTRNRTKQSFVGDCSACAQVAEVRVVENIERLSAKLQLNLFVKLNVLEH
jgi:hypothetical protein